MKMVVIDLQTVLQNCHEDDYINVDLLYAQRNFDILSDPLQKKQTEIFISPWSKRREKENVALFNTQQCDFIGI